MRILSQRLNDQELRLDNKEVHILSQGSELHRCTIIARTSAKNLTVGAIQLNECSIDFRVKLRNFRWCNANLQACNFKGYYSGCDFGHWPDFYDPKGGISGCDFSKATLDGCRFLGCDTSTLQFPGWPNFTILNPAARAQEIQAVAWPGTVSILMNVLADSPEAASAVTGFAPAVIKDFGGTEADLKEALERLGDVQL